MKVLNLRCVHGHAFEGWFASEDDFQSQLQRQLVGCPMCGDQDIAKLPSAPRLNLSGARAGEAGPGRGAAAPSADTAPASGAGARAGAAAAPSSGADGASAGVPAELQALWLQAMQQVVARTEDVGARFPEEARRIHYGEAPERGIRGQATPQEREALADEGIEVVALPLPPGLKGPLQ